MESNNFSPQQSLDLITQVIQDARSSFSEDGVVYTMWGALLMIASLGQYYLLHNGFMEINFYPYFLMPVGAVISFLYYRKKASSSSGNNLISQVNRALWIACSFNMLILGFAFAHILQANLTPVILILLGIGLSVSGISIRSKLLQFSGIFTNLAAVACFWVDWADHSLVTALVALVAIFIPGIILMNRFKKVNVSRS